MKTRWMPIVLAAALVGGLAMNVSPQQQDDDTTKKARKVYRQYCAPCHGEKGKGDGDAAQGLVIKPPDFTQSSFFKKRTKEQIKSVIRNGKSLCPPHGSKINEEAIDALADYITTLVALDFDARAFYAKRCAPCHGPRGRGDGPLAETFDPPPTNFARVGYSLNEQEAFAVIKNGKNGCPAWGKKLSDLQIEAMIEYLKRF